MGTGLSSSRTSRPNGRSALSSPMARATDPARPNPGESATAICAPWSRSQRQAAATTPGEVHASDLPMSKLGFTSTLVPTLREQDCAMRAASSTSPTS